MLIVFSCIGGEKPPDVLLFFAEKRLKNSFFFLCFSVAKSSKKPLDVLFRLPEKTSEKTFFPAFRWRKAAKATRPIPMAASGRLKAASGDCAGLQANRPRRSCFQPSGRFPAIGTKSGIALRKKERRTAGWRFQEKLVDTGFRGALPYINNAAAGGTIVPHSRLTRKKRVRAAARPPRGGAKA
ncbi:hypothetical protein [uncultured Alistipes sp.]|uniref:hypothetical protein n=1 Tax=uncultured Alistipes sp. TaxID=538949 RepID=UPI002805ABA1|nr:hypothetical protein [uncultured Alistipes sp.]